jgi:hypothetical protein
MSLTKRLFGFFLALFMVSLVGCASGPGKEGTGEYVDDAVITTKVKAAIFNEPNLKSAEVNVETYKGVVQLSGSSPAPPRLPVRPNWRVASRVWSRYVMTCA